ncbi:MAG: DMT family transporter, partial [Bacteriovoracaceae bacterium]|nr:DMT family transporter [Bacteriovoracaceae bacterium]
AIGVFTQIAQVFMTKAYMAESASKISHFNYLTAVWALLTGVIFFDEMLSWISIAGMFVIIASVIMSSRFASVKVAAK